MELTTEDGIHDRRWEEEETFIYWGRKSVRHALGERCAKVSEKVHTKCFCSVAQAATGNPKKTAESAF